MFDPIDPYYIGESLKALRKHCDDCGSDGLSWPVPVENIRSKTLFSLCDDVRIYGKGKMITEQNQSTDSLFIVRSGAVKAYYIDGDGNERVSGFFLPGDIFGLDSFSMEKSAYATKMLSIGQIYRVPFEELDKLALTHPNFQHYLLKLMSYEVFDAKRLSVLNSHYSADTRLAFFLLNMSARFQQQRLSATTFNLPMSRIEISSYLGLSPETVSRSLANFQHRQWIEVSGKCICLLNTGKLYEVVTGKLADHEAYNEEPNDRSAA